MQFTFHRRAEAVRRHRCAGSRWRISRTMRSSARTIRAFRSTWRKLMSAQGLMGITIPEADGGQGGTLMDAVIAIEQVAAVCPRSADVVQFGNFGPIRTFAEYGTPAQKERWLPDAPAGGMVMSLGMTEPDAGSAVDRSQDQREAGRRALRHQRHQGVLHLQPGRRGLPGLRALSGPASAASARCWSSATRRASPSARRRAS